MTPRTPRNLFKIQASELPPQVHTWVLGFIFLVLVVANACLSYGDLTFAERFWFYLIDGLVLFILFMTTPKEKSDFLQLETLPAIPAWVWILTCLLAGWSRLTQLTSLSLWPNQDEGIFGYFALKLCEKWDWSLLQGLNQLPALYSWIHAGLFKLLGPSLFSLWLYPALWSILTLPAAWFASRSFFSRSLSLIILGITAFSFWPLFLGRFSTQAVFMVFWECVEFWILGLYLRAGPSSKDKRLLGLGVWTGLGFYTYLSWVGIAVMTILALLGNRSRKPGKRLTSFSIFCLLSLAVSAPLLFTFLSKHMDYLRYLWAMGPNHSTSEHLDLLLGYLQDLFWGVRSATFHYGPLWGGFLNPLLGSLFFLGLILLLRMRPYQFGSWFFISVIVCFFPVFLSDNFEDMRLVQLIPFLMVGAGVGLQWLIRGFRSWKSLIPMILILSVSATLDFHHLFLVYPTDWGERPVYYGAFKSIEFFRAYPYLKEAAEKDGAGLIFLNFNVDPFDQTMRIAAHGFNSAENSDLRSIDARWAGLLGNIHEEPYLREMFPTGKGFWLSKGLGSQNGGTFLDIVLIDKSNRELFARWTKADQALAELTDQVMELGVDPDQTGMLRVLDKNYPLFQGDPLLESRFWRIRAIHLCAQGDYPQAIEDEKKAIQKGHPMAHLYNEMGCILFKQGRMKEAEKAFRAALGLKMNATNAAKNLEAMMSDEKNLRTIPGGH
jgi:tetratricopeptide (TPR) repeat protein